MAFEGLIGLKIFQQRNTDSRKLPSEKKPEKIEFSSSSEYQSVSAIHFSTQFVQMSLILWSKSIFHC